MKVLSLFDGMACGMLAFQGVGVDVERYVAYEIDKYAIKVSTHNFPMIEQRGDVFHADFTEFEGFDAVVGGSPCTYWSIAQKKDIRETEAHGIGWELFQQYVRAIREAKPKFFIYENNKSMANTIKEEISSAFGFEPIMINSALVSAQNRQRYYWVGIRQEDGTYKKADIEQPIDRGIVLRDVLDDGWVTDKDKSHAVIGSMGRTTHREYFQKAQGQMVAGLIPLNPTMEGEKARTLMAGYYKYGMATMVTNEGFKGGTTAVAEPVCLRYERTEEGKRLRKDYESGKVSHGFNEHKTLQPRTDGKTNTVSTVQKDNMVAEPVGSVGNMYGKGQNGQLFGLDSKTKTLSAGTGQTGRGIGSNNSPKAILPVEVRGMSFELAECNDKDEGVIAKLDMPGTYKMLTRVYSSGGKAPTITAGGGGNIEPKVFSDTTKVVSNTPTPHYIVKDGMITIKGKSYPIKLPDGEYIIRKLTVSECKRLQTVPEDYDMTVISNSQAYKCLGNGWTVDVIVHLIESVMREMVA